MEPIQLSRTKAPVRESSPYQPLLNGAEPAQRTLPSSTLRTSTPDPEMPIFSPIPTRPRPSHMAEAGPSTTSMAIEVDTTPGNFPAKIDQHTGQGSTAQVATMERRRQMPFIHPRQRFHDRLQKEEPRGAEEEKERSDQQRKERRARKLRERRLQVASTDALANSLSALSTDEPERNVREERNHRIRHKDHEIRARQLRRKRDQRMAERFQQMRDVEQNIQRRAEGKETTGERGAASGPEINDVPRTDISSVHGGPTEEAKT